MLLAGVRNEWAKFIGVKDLYEAKVTMATMCKVYMSVIRTVGFSLKMFHQPTV